MPVYLKKCSILAIGRHILSVMFRKFCLIYTEYTTNDTCSKASAAVRGAVLAHTGSKCNGGSPIIQFYCSLND